MIINLDPGVHAGHRALQDPLDVDVELVGNAVDHVDPDHADAQARWRDLNKKNILKKLYDI